MVAGQVRMCRESVFQRESVVLIADAVSSAAKGTEERPYVAVVLKSSDETLNNRVEQAIRPDSPERIKELFPILLNAELTYSEAK